MMYLIDLPSLSSLNLETHSGATETLIANGSETAVAKIGDTDFCSILGGERGLVSHTLIYSASHVVSTCTLLAIMQWERAYHDCVDSMIWSERG